MSNMLDKRKLSRFKKSFTHTLKSENLYSEIYCHFIRVIKGHKRVDFKAHTIAPLIFYCSNSFIQIWGGVLYSNYE